MHGTSVERKGLSDVMEGVEMAINQGVNFYTLWQGKNLKFTYDDDDIGGTGLSLLHDMLNVSAKSGSKAIYTLRFYKNLGKGDAITNATPFTYSFNFKLNDDGLNYYPAQNMPMVAGTGGADPALLQEIKKLNERLDAIEGGEEEEEEQTALEKISGIIEHPLTQKAMDFIAAFLSRSAMPTQQTGISGIEPAKIQDSIKRLAAVDPQLGLHLELLANLAEKNKAFYDMAISQLKSMA